MTPPDPTVARAIAAVTRRGGLDECGDEELLASAIYADEVAAALRTARAALWSELADRPGWSYTRIARETGTPRSTVHDVVTEYRRRTS